MIYVFDMKDEVATHMTNERNKSVKFYLAANSPASEREALFFER